MSCELKQQHVYDLIQSSYATNILFVLTKRGVFDRLLQGPASAAALALELGLAAEVLHDLLLFAQSIEFVKRDGETFKLAKKGLPLTAKAGSWLRAYLLVWGEQLNPAFGQLGAQLDTGANAFALANGQRIWDFYSAHAEQNEIFVDFMHGVTNQAHIPVILREFELGGARSLLDVAGGVGSLACGLAGHYPQLRTAVYDQPSNAQKAAGKIGALGLAARCAFIGGNIFDSVPGDYDLYTIKHVLHDWDDKNAGAILASIAAAMRADARLVIIEGLLDRGFDQPTPEMPYLHTRNIEQRAWTPGRVRTTADFQALCAAAGLTIEQVRHSATVDISYISCVKQAITQGG